MDAAASLRASGVCVDVVYTSTLKRTVKTAWLVLEALDRYTVPIHHRWQLNERMYGALTGLNKADTKRFLGDAPFEQLRRQPPPLERGSCYDPAVSAALRSIVGATPPAAQRYREAPPPSPARPREAIGGSAAGTGSGAGTGNTAGEGARDTAGESAGASSGEEAAGDAGEAGGDYSGGAAAGSAIEQARLAAGRESRAPDTGGGLAEDPTVSGRAGFASGSSYGGMQVPTAESFEDTRDRVLPCWEDEILPMAKAGKTVLVVSSKNTLRSLIHGPPIPFACHLPSTSIIQTHSE